MLHYFREILFDFRTNYTLKIDHLQMIEYQE